MKKVFLFTISILMFSNISFSQGSISMSKKHKSKISLDSLSYIQIDKVIYYQTPIEAHLGRLTSDQYEPDWYNAYCVNENVNRFKDNPSEALKYIHKSIVISDSDMINIIRNYKPNPKIVPYSYFFGEVRLTHKATGEKIVIVFEKDNETRLPEFTMKLPSKNNSSKEKLDSIRMQAVAWNLFIEQNGVVKFPSSRYVDSLLTNNYEFFIKPNLDDFKNLLFRRKDYKASNRVNGKRQFATMEKKTTGHVMKSVSEKP